MNHVDSLALLFAPPIVLAVLGVALAFRDRPLERQVYLIVLAVIVPLCVYFLSS